MNTSILVHINNLSYKNILLLSIFIVFLSLYIPTFVEIWRTVWIGEDQQHGPIILAVSLYLLISNFIKNKLYQIHTQFSLRYYPLLIFGCIMYIIGKSQGLDFFEVGSVLPILSSLILIFLGHKIFKKLLFPIIFLIFLIPLPGTLIDQITQPLKISVSAVVEMILFHLDYPVARSGVILQVGQYSLLVADACAGLHTIFALEAMCLLYLNLINRNSIFRNIMMALCVIPISFISNVIRVISISLVTYYFGDEIGQGFLHDFAGIILFVVALLMIIGLDNIICSILIRKHNSSTA